jgi:rubrerythrin
MGHSVVTITREGLLNSSQVKAVVESKKEEDKYEHGHGESADSWVHADYPKAKNTDRIYSETMAWEIANNINGYDAIFIYYVPDKIWTNHFNSNQSKIEKIKIKLKKCETELQEVSTEALNNSEVKSWLDQKNSVDNVLIACPDCKSKIHAPSYFWMNKKIPERCPVCRADNSNFSNLWREELYGKRYVSKRNKIAEEIKKLHNEVAQLQSCTVEEISVRDLEKKENQALKDAARTLIAADIHH